MDLLAVRMGMCLARGALSWPLCLPTNYAVAFSHQQRHTERKGEGHVGITDQGQPNCSLQEKNFK